MYTALSGTQITYLKIKNDWSLISIHHSFYRLTIPLGLTILFVSAIPQYMGYGPFFFFNTYQGPACRDEGWKVLLYVNNFYEEAGGVRVNQ